MTEVVDNSPEDAAVDGHAGGDSRFPFFWCGGVYSLDLLDFNSKVCRIVAV